MTDMGGGIFVSRTDADGWEPDEEVGGSVHVLFEEGDTAGGLWKPAPGGGRAAAGHRLPARETIVILEGTVRIEIEGGATLELGVGDMASLPKGAVTTWYPSPDFKEVWFYS